MKKRILSLVLSVVMTVSMLPVKAQANESGGAGQAVTPRTIALSLTSVSNLTKTDGTTAVTGKTVDGKMVYSCEEEGWSWNNTDKVLTLSGLQLTASVQSPIYLPAKSKIVLAKGSENTVTSTYESPDYLYGLYCAGNLTITCSDAGKDHICGEDCGKLTVSGGRSTGDRWTVAAIYLSSGKLTVDGGIVTGISAESAGPVSGIEAYKGSIVVNNGRLKAVGGKAGMISSMGISSSTIVINGGVVEAEGGQAPIKSNGIYATEITMNGGMLDAAGGTVTKQSNSSYTSCGILAGGNFYMNGGKLTAKGSTGGYSSYGLYVPNYTLTVKGGTVEAEGADASESGESVGVFAKNWTIENGTVTGKGGQSKQSFGIYASNIGTVNGGTVTGTGGKSAASYGVVGQTLKVNGGTVTGTGDESATNSYGVGGTLSAELLGGVITARGKNAAVNGGSQKLTAGNSAITALITGAVDSSGNSVTSANGTITGRVLQQSGTDPVVLSFHKHSWSYSVDGNKIQARCTSEENPCEYYSKAAISELTAEDMDYSKSSYNKAVLADGITAVTGATAGSIYYEGIDGTTYSKSKYAPTNAGTYQATVTIGGCTAKAPFTIRKAVPAYTAPTANELKYTGSSQSLVKKGYVSSSYGTMYYSLDGKNWSTAVPSATEAGTYTVYYKISGNKNYEVEPTSIIVKISLEPLTGVSANGYAGTYDGAGHQITVTAPSGATITYSTDGENYSSTNPVFTAAGSYKVYYKVSKTGYEDSTGSENIEIAKADITVQAEDKNKTYGDQDPEFTWKVTSGSLISGDTLAISVKRAEGENVTEDGYLLTPGQEEGANANYNILFKPGKLTIEQREIGIQWSNTELRYNGQEQKPVATATNLKEGDTCNITVTGAQSAVGADYTATASAIDNNNYKLPAKVTTVWSILKALQDAPEGLAGTPETVYGKADGQITGLTTAMEYRKEGQSSYTAVTDAVMTAASGTYYVRYAEKDNYEASDDVKVIVGEGPKLTVTVPAVQEGYTITTSVAEMGWHDTAALTFKLLEGYSKTQNFAVKVNGTKVDLDNDGKYHITDAEENQTITVEGVADVTEPTAKITIKENDWIKFWNTLTFGMFFKEVLEVEITAEDVNTGSGLKDIYYYLADKEMTIDEVKALTAEQWKEYTGKFSMNEDRSYVVYAKAADNAGNVAYLNSDGIVIDQTLPVITGVKNQEVYYGDTSFKVDDVNLDSVTVDGNPATLDETTGEYNIPADNEEHTILVTDKSGNQTEYKITVCKIYTVTYVADGVVVDIQNIGYGKDAAAPEIPEKTGYDQTAPVWDKEGKNITGDTTIKAVYTINKYTVTYVADDKTVDTQTVEHGSDAAEPEIPEKTGYDQTAPVWDKEGKNITGDTTIKAVYTINKYTVTYVADDKTVDTQTVEHGSDAEAPEIPEKTGYDQTAPVWDKEGKNITGDTTIKAVYTINKYTVTYVADDKTVDTQTVEHGSDAEAPEIPEKTGYDQTAPVWDKEGKNITGDTTIKAVYTINKYTVTYVADDKTVDTQTVEHGSDAEAPEIPEKTGYDQTAPVWDKEGKNITGDTTIKAVYTINKYKVTIPDIQIGYTLTSDVSERNWHESVTLTYMLEEGYSETEKFAVYVNGAKVTFTDGKYTIPEVEEDIAVTVEGVADITAPVGEITAAENKWNSFLNTITFGKFFKETQSVSITAGDKGSGVKSIEYYVADDAMSEDAVKEITGWSSYEKAFDIIPSNKYVIYAKLTDNDGNVKYISTDGIVLENIAPVFVGIADGNVYCESVEFTVTDEYLDSVKADGIELKAVDGTYSIAADNRSHTIIAADKAGNEKAITITVYDGHTWGEWIPVTEPTCTGTGLKKHICQHCEKEETEEIPAYGHKAGSPVVENRVEATCTTDGSYEEVVYCTVCEEELSRTKSIISKTGHKYGEPEFKLSEDNSSASVTFTCEHDGHVEIVETKENSVTSEVTKEATGTQKGEITYTITVEFEGQTYTDTIVKETTVAQTEEIGNGTITTEVIVAEDVPNTAIDNLTVEVAKELLTPEEMAAVENGEDITVYLETKNINDTVTAADKKHVEGRLDTVVDKILKEETLTSKRQVTTGIEYLDLSLYKQIGSNTATKLKTTGEKELTITIEIPKGMKSENAKRSYYIIRVHENGEASEIDILPATRNSDDTLTFTTDRFSTYAIAYAEPNDTVVVTEAVMDKESVTITEKGGSVQLSVSVAPAHAPNKKVAWSSSNTAVATVDENGKVTAVGNGTCIITVTTEDEGKTDTCTITVDIPEEPEIPEKPETPSETPGGNTENNGNTDIPNTPNLPDADKPNNNQGEKEDSKDSQAAQTQDISDSNFRISLMLFSAAVVAGIRVRKKKYCR